MKGRAGMEKSNGIEECTEKEEPKGVIKKYRIDIIVVATLLFVSLAILLVANLVRKAGNFVRVEVDGEVVAEYPLSLDGVYTLNGGTNELTISEGIAYMSYSSCPDHTCENTGRVKLVGQTIICLPNRLSITVIGESDDYVDFVP